MAGLMLGIGLIVFLNFRTARVVSRDLQNVQQTQLPRFESSVKLSALFREISRTYEYAGVTGDESLLTEANQRGKEFTALVLRLEREAPESKKKEFSRVRSTFTDFDAAAKSLTQFLLRNSKDSLEIGMTAMQASKVVVKKQAELLLMLDSILNRSRIDLGSQLEAASADVRFQSLQTLILGFLIGAILSLFLFVLARSIIGPLAVLSEVSADISSGGLREEFDLTPTSNDEIGALTVSFAKMVEGLKASTVSKSYVDNIIASMADTLIVLTPGGQISSVNPAALQLLDFREKELLGEDYRRIFPKGEFLFAVENDFQQTGFVQDFETSYRRSDGRSVPVMLSAAAMLSAGGKMRGIVCVAQDYTKRKEIEIALQKARDAAVDGAKAKMNFLANMSHEIRTPLNAVIGMSDLLAESELSPEHQELVYTIESSSEALLMLTNDILDVSKMEAGKLDLESVVFDLYECVETSVQLLAMKAHSKGLEIAVQIGANVPKRAIGDSIRLRQVLINFLSNAVKFTTVGEIVVRAMLVEKSGECPLIRISVSDTGMGISEEEQETLWDAFTQPDTSVTRLSGGTGLGLNISKRIAEAMNGEIGVTSTKGKGSRFWIEFPCEAVTAAMGQESPQELKGVRALIVDDNKTSRKVLDAQLSVFGMRVANAESGERGLTVLQDSYLGNDPIEIVLLDMNMPGMNGAAFARNLRAIAHFADLPILLLTSLVNVQKKGFLEELGIQAAMTKPPRRDELQNKLKNLLLKGTPTAAWTRGVAKENKEFFGRLRVLLVEDHPVSQRVATLQLKRLGISVDSVSNGQEALDALIEIPYEIVLMDCLMPVMDGFEATRKVRRRESDGFHTTILAMTEIAMAGDRGKCLDAGMDDYLPKPVTLKSIREVFHRWGAPVDYDILRKIKADFPEKDPGGYAKLLDDLPRQTSGLMSVMQGALTQPEAEAGASAAKTLQSLAKTLGARHLESMAHRVGVYLLNHDLRGPAEFARLEHELEIVLLLYQSERSSSQVPSH